MFGELRCDRCQYPAHHNDLHLPAPVGRVTDRERAFEAEWTSTTTVVEDFCLFVFRHHSPQSSVDYLIWSDLSRIQTDQTREMSLVNSRLDLNYMY